MTTALGWSMFLFSGQSSDGCSRRKSITSYDWASRCRCERPGAPSRSLGPSLTVGGPAPSRGQQDTRPVCQGTQWPSSGVTRAARSRERRREGGVLETRCRGGHQGLLRPTGTGAPPAGTQSECWGGGCHTGPWAQGSRKQGCSAGRGEGSAMALGQKKSTEPAACSVGASCCRQRLRGHGGGVRGAQEASPGGEVQETGHVRGHDTPRSCRRPPPAERTQDKRVKGTLERQDGVGLGL